MKRLICLFAVMFSLAMTYGQVKEDWDSKPMLFAQTMATYNGGNIKTFQAALVKSITDDAAYDAEKHKGQVIMTFVLRPDCSIDEINVLRSSNPELDAMAKSKIPKLKGWTPAMQGDVAVSLKFTIAVSL